MRPPLACGILDSTAEPCGATSSAFITSLFARSPAGEGCLVNARWGRFPRDTARALVRVDLPIHYLPTPVADEGRGRFFLRGERPAHLGQGVLEFRPDLEDVEFPFVLGRENAQVLRVMPLEECGNMVVMMLAYAQRKHNDQYLADNWDLLEKWAGYLIEDAKIPANQLSTDDFAGHLA